MIEEFLNIDDIGMVDISDNNEFESLMSGGNPNELGDVLSGSLFSTDGVACTDSISQSFQLVCPAENAFIGFSNSEISFGSNIDDLYDPQIQSEHDDAMYHRHAAENAYSYNDLIYHRHEETSALRGEEYWIDSKFDAENEHMKVEAEREYQDFLNEHYSISHVEDLYDSVYRNNHVISFGSSENYITDDGSSSISFQGCQEDARNIAASELQNKLDTYHIYYPGTLTSSDSFGGWDRYTGQKIHDAIQNARNSGTISDTLYKELIRDLKRACYYQ